MFGGMISEDLSSRYRILRKLGEGGMGEVWLAEHVNLQRKEALKILKPALADDPQFVSRFRREARATNRVQHPNIVSVYDFGQLPDGRFYLSMEYADGVRLDQVLRNSGALPLPRVLNILHQLAEAVEHAHGLGVVHCDLKPENLILVEHRRRPDVLKVLDFGIAKMSQHERDEAAGATRQGQVFGTPHYMAPEQVASEPIDGRTDLYAIGCIAFELAVGKTVFSGRTVEVISSHLRTPVDAPSRQMSGLPAEFDALVLRCLQKSPDQRFQDGRELRQAIERVPGFASGRTSSSKRRFGSHLRLPTFENDDTESNVGANGRRKLRSGPLDDAAAIAHSPTLGIDDEELRTSRREALLELVEGLLDIGHDDVQLLIGASRLKELGDELHRNQEESAQIETRAAEVEQATRERESSLRFALGEMVFARSQAQAAGQPPPADLEQQIGLIERRLARLSQDLEKTLAQLTERAIALAAGRADIQETMATECAPLEHRVEEILPRYEQSPAIRPAAVAWRTLRGL
jgi:serine/threonine protein kinase